MVDRLLVVPYTLLGLLPLAVYPALFYALVFGGGKSDRAWRVNSALGAITAPLRRGGGKSDRAWRVNSALGAITAPLRRGGGKSDRAWRLNLRLHDRMLFIRVIVSVTVANAVLLAVMLVLGLLGWFRFWTAGGLTLMLIVAPTALWRRLFARDEAADAAQAPTPTRAHLADCGPSDQSPLLLTLFLLFCLGALVIRRYPYHSDTWLKYLGAGAAVAETGQIPSLDLAALQVDYSNAPLMMLYNAWEFSLWGRDDRVARAIPVYFSMLTLLLLFAWPAVADKGGERSGSLGSLGCSRRQYVFPYLVTGILISSQAFFRSFVGIIQEPPLLFYVTVGLYFLWRTVDGGQFVDYCLAVVACTCALLTKFSAPIPVLLMAFVLLACTPGRFARKLVWGLLLSWPATLWLGRNWVMWGNPLYPQLESLLGRPGRLHELTLLAGQIASVNLQAAWISPMAFLKDVALTFPFAPLVLARMTKERRHPLTWIVVAGGLATLAFLFVTGARWLERYFYTGIGLYALYAALGAFDLWEAVSVKWRLSAPGWLRWRWTPPALVGSLMAALLVALYVKHPVPYVGRPYERAVLDYVKAHVPAGETCTVLIDARIVTWYDPARVYRQWRFHDLPFLLATNGEFDLEGDAAYFREELVKAGVQYVYSSPQRKTRPHFWDEVLSHPDHFERVLTIDGASLSRVRANVLDPAGGVE